MALPIRPGFPPSTLQAQGVSRPDPSRAAGQRAFFEAALNQRPAPTAAEAGVAQPTTRSPMGKIPASLPADPPERILRPGSLLDIKV